MMLVGYGSARPRSAQKIALLPFTGRSGGGGGHRLLVLHSPLTWGGDLRIWLCPCVWYVRGELIERCV